MGRDEARAFLLGEPDVTVRMLTPLCPVPGGREERRALFSVTSGGRSAKFEAGETASADHSEVELCERLIQKARLLPDDENRAERMKLGAPYIFHAD
jgi:hypothetical protein